MSKDFRGTSAKFSPNARQVFLSTLFSLFTAVSYWTVYTSSFLACTTKNA